MRFSRYLAAIRGHQYRPRSEDCRRKAGRCGDGNKYVPSRILGCRVETIFLHHTSDRAKSLEAGFS